MKRAATLIAAATTLVTLAGCQPKSVLIGADNSVPYTANPFSRCPKGDAGRLQDKTLVAPDQWVCVRD